MVDSTGKVVDVHLLKSIIREYVALYLVGGIQVAKGGCKL